MLISFLTYNDAERTDKDKIDVQYSTVLSVATESVPSFTLSTKAGFLVVWLVGGNARALDVLGQPCCLLFLK
jgi:hypothetical protein